MKRVLVDTHALLWFVFDDPRLSRRAGDVLEDRAVSKVVSIVSLWEIVIKVQLGRLALGMSMEEFFNDFVTGRRLDLLPVEICHLLAYDRLPLHHRDPFDRLLIAQAITAKLPLVTADAAFSAYPVETVW